LQRRYASAFLDVVYRRQTGYGRIDGAVDRLLATWDGSAELREFFANPAIPDQKVGFWIS